MKTANDCLVPGPACAAQKRTLPKCARCRCEIRDEDEWEESNGLLYHKECFEAPDTELEAARRRNLNLLEREKNEHAALQK